MVPFDKCPVNAITVVYTGKVTFNKVPEILFFQQNGGGVIYVDYVDYIRYIYKMSVCILIYNL